MRCKLGITNGIQDFSTRGKFAVSQTFKALSGRLVVKDISTDRWKICGSAEAYIGGFVDDVPAAVTVDGDAFQINKAKDTEYEIPYYNDSGIAFTEAILDILIGKHADIYVASSIQYVDCTGMELTTEGNGGEAVLEIIGGNIAEQTLFVKVAVGKWLTVA